MKMKIIYLLLFTCFISCNDNTDDTSATTTDTTMHIPAEPIPDTPVNNINDQPTQPESKPKVYSNARFRDVTVQKAGDNKYTIQGKGQIFEASFGWVVEDGHNEIKEGFDMTDAGAPAWGNFKFTIDVKKERSNSTLTLILFETSAKDGSRVHQLPIVLE
jgi:hypothetical protein